MAWRNQKILFVSGKGGVGKSLVAAAIARSEAKRGRRVLLAELGDSSYYKDFWHLAEASHEPIPAPGESFDVVLWSGESCLREYVLHYLKVDRLYRLFFENKVMRSLINVAPGLSEIALLGKITSGIRKTGPPLDYDLIVVDTFATGHAMALFRAPKGMMEAIRFGPMGHQSREMQAVLTDAEQTGFVLVALLEELPVVETLEFEAMLKSEFGIVPDIVANKVMPIPATHAELTRLHNTAQGGVRELSGYLLGVEARQDRLLGELKKSGRKPIEVPLIFSEKPEVLVREAAAALADGGADEK
ncbi:MAG: ArsA family ATPase [Bdellovibrionaceae bacterium]|nr:ArsA family ATPase [Pseudobdellovibrionaceae bacterium]